LSARPGPEGRATAAQFLGNAPETAAHNLGRAAETVAQKVDNPGDEELSTAAQNVGVEEGPDRPATLPPRDAGLR